MTATYVVFKLDGAEYALPAAQVVQMESYDGATRVPGSAPYVAGIVQVRGRVVPVVDLRLRFALPAIERTLDARIIIAQDGDRPVGLLVDSAREVLELDEAQLEAPPSLVSDHAGGFVRAVARLDGRLVMIVDFRKVIGETQSDAHEGR
ncbi:MAG: chemotaxis protein CheW [Polyangia bacterium]